LKTQNDWTSRQQTVKQKLNEIVGPFPEKTPLNPRVTGILKKNGYRVEKIVFESMPGFYVSGCLFIPDGIKKSAPAVLNLIGHEQESFRAELDQVIILNLVKKGLIVFTIDPLGQGEHVQYYDPEVIRPLVTVLLSIVISEIVSYPDHPVPGIYMDGIRH
jgi:cephalosporin-C deacetylase-like acetyl esterase